MLGDVSSATMSEITAAGWVEYHGADVTRDRRYTVTAMGLALLAKSRKAAPVAPLAAPTVEGIPFGTVCTVAELDAGGACWLDRPFARGLLCQDEPSSIGGDACRFDSVAAWDAFDDAQQTAPQCRKVAALCSRAASTNAAGTSPRSPRTCAAT
jgi:hypothetical protein